MQTNPFVFAGTVYLLAAVIALGVAGLLKLFIVLIASRDASSADGEGREG